MKMGNRLHAAREHVCELLHFDKLKRMIHSEADPERSVVAAWVIVYRTASGFCCMYRDEEIDFREIMDVHLWAEEKDVQPYFIGQ
ncbi:hypothetical protein AWB81_06375 [Caballeronia arationis]|uniref:hypothetical protein n=1 Tax=Caballeronia arationis TaxID=1777142 RepID=UPI00074BFE0F|nr:hypothetical protein [Caballeronia arationis]SAL03289.1 hypothetical protein AWB81_06375 [Caballeronia arationis]